MLPSSLWDLPGGWDRGEEKGGGWLPLSVCIHFKRRCRQQISDVHSCRRQPSILSEAMHEAVIIDLRFLLIGTFTLAKCKAGTNLITRHLGMSNKVATNLEYQEYSWISVNMENVENHLCNIRENCIKQNTQCYALLTWSVCWDDFTYFVAGIVAFIWNDS